jgi:hypothetical protein
MTPAQLAQAAGADGAYGPWSLTDTLLARAGDALEWLMYAKTDGKGTKPTPFPRPGVKSAVTPINDEARAFLQRIRDQRGA